MYQAYHQSPNPSFKAQSRLFRAPLRSRCIHALRLALGHLWTLLFLTVWFTAPHTPQVLVVPFSFMVINRFPGSTLARDKSRWLSW